MSSKILIIEDDEILRENTAELLSLAGYEVYATDNGKDGIRKLQHYLPDLVLCDVMMPETDGFSVLYARNQNNKTATIPFIFLTAKNENKDLRQGMELGADDYISKPFEDIDLLNAIETQLKKRSLIFDKKSELTTSTKDQKTYSEILEELLKDTTKISLKAGETLFHQNEYPHTIYYLEKGSIKTYKISNQGKSFITGIYHQGSIIGYKPVIENRRYNQYAESNEICIIKKLPAKDFLQAIYKNSEMAEYFIHLMSKRLSRKEEELLNLAYTSVRYRVAYKLLELSDGNSETTIDIPKSDLAHMVGTTSETLARTLSEFETDDLIAMNNSGIKLPDPEKIQLAMKRF